LASRASATPSTASASASSSEASSTHDALNGFVGLFVISFFFL
jgi:hypothetical protein